MSDNDAYRFAITGQQVVAVQEWDDGRWEHERIDHDERYQVSGNQVIRTEWDDGRQEITTYQDTDGDGVYQKVFKYYASDDSYPFDGSASRYETYRHDNDDDDSYHSQDSSLGYASDAYRFTITDQQVVAVQEWDDGRWEHERIDHDERYQVSGNQVIRTEWDDGRQEITTYQDTDGDGVYQKVFKYYASDDSYPFDGSASRYETYCHDDDDDSSNHQHNDDDKPDWLTGFTYANDILLTDMAMQAGTDAADHFIVADSGLFTVLDFNYRQGDRLVFDTGMGLSSSEDLAANLTGLSYQGDTLQLSFGNYAQISLTGIAANEISWGLIDVIS